LKFFGIVHSDSVSSIECFGQDRIVSGSIDGSISLYNDKVRKLLMEADLRDGVYLRLGRADLFAKL
jgi:hypothetical protein